MNGENGGGSREDIGRVAPVIPLFGARNTAPPASIAKAVAATTEHSGRAERTSSAESARHLRSVPDASAAVSNASNSASASASSASASVSFVDDNDEDGGASDPVESRKAAEESLVRKLRTRSLSVSEARQVLRTHGLDSQQIDDVIDDFLRRRYLDDQELAQMLVSAGVDRKGQGRVAISRSLSQRGIPRDVITAALDELPDDDAERALEFARTKARSLSRLDHDTALRRLLGQLARRGYGGSVATNAARTALNEAAFGAKSSGVRFVESD